ncbi:MAG: HAD-IIIA family hydrolase [Sulfurovaceae bacterium]|nr:HAD-IIIA family hydrolase [Sulfurovaceae bacterium]
MSIELLVLDVDGTLTDGRITYSASGDEVKSFNVKDGLGIEGWIGLGKEVAIITGRRSEVIARRAKELKIKYFFEGVKNKNEVLSSLMEDLSLVQSQVAAIGDDFNDLSMIRAAGLSFAPADANEYILEQVDIKLATIGGSGAVREMIEYIVKEEGLWESFIKQW